MVGLPRVLRVVGGRGLPVSWRVVGSMARRWKAMASSFLHGQVADIRKRRRAAAAREACGDVQQPVAELLRLGSSQLPVQEEGTGPGQQVDCREAEFEPGGVDVEVAGGEAAESGGLAAPDVFLDGGMPR